MVNSSAGSGPAVPVHPCAVCGQDVAETAMVYAAAPRRPDRPLIPGAIYCSKGCYQAGLTADRAKRRCVHCARGIEPQTGPGRPRSYCSNACKHARERAAARAWRSLAKGPLGDPVRKGEGAEAHRRHGEEIRAALAELQLIVDLWSAKLRGKAPADAPDVPAGAMANTDQVNNVSAAMRQKGQRLQDALGKATRAAELHGRAELRDEQHRARERDAARRRRLPWPERILAQVPEPAPEQSPNEGVF